MAEGREKLQCERVAEDQQNGEALEVQKHKQADASDKEIEVESMDTSFKKDDKEPDAGWQANAMHELGERAVCSSKDTNATNPSAERDISLQNQHLLAHERQNQEDSEQVLDTRGDFEQKAEGNVEQRTVVDEPGKTSLQDSGEKAFRRRCV